MLCKEKQVHKGLCWGWEMFSCVQHAGRCWYSVATHTQEEQDAGCGLRDTGCSIQDGGRQSDRHL
jgi:hypothetical protein